MQKYGLIGFPLGHSFSRNFFNKKFETENIDAQYLNFEIPTIGAFKQVIKDNPELNGLNVTIPYKQQIIPLLDGLDEDARQIGAVGASKAVFHGLKQLGIKATFVSRESKESCLTYDALTLGVMAEHTVIVNTTPLGMFPNIHNCPNIPYDLLSPRHILYDLVYNPDETLFMTKGKERGAVVKNGLEMLWLQAVAAWNIWQKQQ